jgi:transposase
MITTAHPNEATADGAVDLTSVPGHLFKPRGQVGVRRLPGLHGPGPQPPTGPATTLSVGLKNAAALSRTQTHRTLTVEQRQQIVRLVVREVLIGEDDITVLHSIPVPTRDPPPGYLRRSGSRKEPNQTLDRTRPILPMLPGTLQRATHDYKRHGTSSLYAALDLTTGKVIGKLHQRHRAIEFHKFLQTIDQQVPKHLDVHLAFKARRSAAGSPPIPGSSWHFTPTSSSWINLVERWFAELTNKELRRSAYQSVRALNADIRAWIENWNENPQPYVWTKPAERILESIARYCQRINQTAHW